MYLIRIRYNVDGYDSLDPNGNITLTWDVILQTANIYDVSHVHYIFLDFLEDKLSLK